MTSESHEQTHPCGLLKIWTEALLSGEGAQERGGMPGTGSTRVLLAVASTLSWVSCEMKTSGSLTPLAPHTPFLPPPRWPHVAPSLTP